MTTLLRATTTPGRRPTAAWRGASAGAVTLLVLGLGLAGCGGGDDSDSGTSASSDAGSAGGSAGGAVSAPKAREDGSAAAGDSGGGDTTIGSWSGAGGSTGGSTRTSARVLPDDGRDIVYTGAITVRVRDVAAAARRVESMTLGMDGLVFSEDTSQLGDGPRLGQADLTLRVPPQAFRTTLDRVGALGKELSRTRSARDVTTELADTDSRVRSQERSVTRVRALLSEADTIGEVVQIESELARREADLESLQAQLARLQDVTDLATVEVTLLAKEAPAPTPVDDEDYGFLVGLKGGLTALLGIVVVGLTVLGALLPFALVAGLLGWPTYVLVRRSRTRTRSRASAPITPSS